MAVTSTFTRVRNTVSVPIFEEVVTAALTGTYVTGGFTWNPFAIVGSPGSSPLPASAVYTVDFYSPKGYIYQTTIVGNTATTKIYSAPNTEFTPGAVPDASATVILLKGR
jgi:hypothetical protein